MLVERGEPYVIALEHVGLPDEERAFLERIGRGSALACPIRVDDRVWGVLEAYSAVGAPPFTTSHVRFAEALCAQVATAIGRAELFSRLESLAYEDPLTRLPNRRALDDRLEEAVARALADRDASCRCCSATSTGSRRSTTGAGTTPATTRSLPPAVRSPRRPRRTPARSPAGSGATSSAW